jgi:very-short-patch-repair endonuclease
MQTSEVRAKQAATKRANGFWDITPLQRHREGCGCAACSGSHSEETKAKIAESCRIARQLRGNDFRRPWTEIYAENALVEARIDYVANIYVAGLEADFYLKEYRTVLEIDGCFVHSCPDHGGNFKSWIRARDLIKDLRWEDAGYSVLRVWEHDLDILNRIIKEEFLCPSL